MARKGTLNLNSHPTKPQTEYAEGRSLSNAATLGVLVIAPPDRLLYLNRSARRLLAGPRHPRKRGADPAVLSQRDALSRLIQQLSARIFHIAPVSPTGSHPLEIRGLQHSLGAHLRVHGLILNGPGDLQRRRAVVTFDRASPR